MVNPMTEFNAVDYVIIGVFVISIMAGLLRGMIKEIIALATWVAAFVVSSMFSVKVATSFTNSSSVQSALTNASSGIAGVNPAEQLTVLSLGMSFIALFATTLIIGSLLGYMISRAVEGHGISLTNHLFGGVFGILRGFLIVLVVIFLFQLAPIAQEPWWAQSRFVVAFQPAVKWLENVVSPQLENLKKKMNDAVSNHNAANNVIDAS